MKITNLSKVIRTYAFMAKAWAEVDGKAKDKSKGKSQGKSKRKGYILHTSISNHWKIGILIGSLNNSSPSSQYICIPDGL